jgi:hypothetical protein
MAGESFNYDDADTPDLEAVRGVAAEMQGLPLKPLTDLEAAERDEWRRDYQARIEQERMAAEQYRLEKEREREAAAQREAAIAAKAERERAQRERAQEIDRQVRRRDMLDLRMAAARQDTFQRNVESAHRNALAYQQRQAILSNLEAMINPPEPPPERVVVVEADPEADEFCGVKVTRPNPRRSWW